MTHFKKTVLTLGLCAVIGLPLAGCSNTWHGMKSDWHGMTDGMHNHSNTTAAPDATTTTTTTTTTETIEVKPNNTPVYN